MNKELIADIRNKLQTTSTLLERVSQGVSVPDNFVEMALKDMDKVKELLLKIKE